MDAKLGVDELSRDTNAENTNVAGVSMDVNSENSVVDRLTSNTYTVSSDIDTNSRYYLHK